MKNKIFIINYIIKIIFLFSLSNLVLAKNNNCELIRIPNCPYCQRVEIVIKDKNIDCKLKNRVLPGMVPKLIYSETEMTESIDILNFLDKTYSLDLYSKDFRERAKQKLWLKKINNFSEITLLELERELKLPFFSGDKFSIVDAVYAPLLANITLSNQKSYPKFISWQKKVLSYPAVKKVVK